MKQIKISKSKYFAKQTVTFGYGIVVSRFHSTEAPADKLLKNIMISLFIWLKRIYQSMTSLMFNKCPMHCINTNWIKK